MDYEETSYLQAVYATGQVRPAFSFTGVSHRPPPSQELTHHRDLPPSFACIPSACRTGSPGRHSGRSGRLCRLGYVPLWTRDRRRTSFFPSASRLIRSLGARIGLTTVDVRHRQGLRRLARSTLLPSLTVATLGSTLAISTLHLCTSAEHTLRYIPIGPVQLTPSLPLMPGQTGPSSSSRSSRT